jgi:hypothetical protein
VDVLDLAWLTPEIAAVQAAHRSRFAAAFSGERPDLFPLWLCGRLYGGSHGLAGTAHIDMLAEPERWLADVLADMAAHVAEAGDEQTFWPLVIEVDPCGVHFVDALFGAPVRFHGGQVWSRELPCAVDELEPVDLGASELFQRTLALAKLAAEVGQGKLLVANPVLSCPLNIGINLFGERLLCALHTAPEAAARALRLITDVIAAAMHAFEAALGPTLRRNTVGAGRYAPAGCGFIDGCADQLVGARHYDQFVAPLDAELLGRFPGGGMIHLCGAVAQHIPTWAAMAPLRQVQVNDRATEDLPAWVAARRSDQVLYVTPTASTPVPRVVEVTGGQRVVLMARRST